jgi:glycosyltransferase involved in cell wall biosynthesis
MRVLINGMVLNGKKTGIGHYTAELVRCLAPLLGAESLCVHRPAWVEAARRWLIRLRPPANSTPSPSSQPPQKTPSPSVRGRVVNALRDVGKAAYQYHFQRTAGRGFALYHEPNFLPMDCDLPTVTTVHDLSVLLHPEWHPADRVASYERDFESGLARSQHVITISENARQEIIRHLGMPADRVSRTYMGIRPGLRPMPREEVETKRRALNLPPNYLLYLGTIEPRKNLMTLLRAYCALPGAVRAEFPLVLVGGWGWNSADVAEFLQDEARHMGVLYLGYVDEAHLGVLYNGARALVFPSRYEGFGLPPIEMMACGGAVLASTAGSIVETVGRQAHLTDPDDLDGWRQALLRVCTDQDWWLGLRRGAEETARPFTWEQCALDTLAVYDRVLYGRVSKLVRAA